MKSQDWPTFLDQRVACDCTKVLAVFLVWMLAAITAPAQTVTVLHTFSGTDGMNPYGALVQGFDGKFYGTTNRGGTSTNSNCNSGSPSGCGTVFKVGRYGDFSTLFNMDFTNGELLESGLVLARTEISMEPQSAVEQAVRLPAPCSSSLRADSRR